MSKAARSARNRTQASSAVKPAVTAQISVTPNAAAAKTPMVPRRRGLPVVTDLKEATAARYPYVVPELKLVGILAAGVTVLLIILFFTLS
jgi:hypothetical protein